MLHEMMHHKFNLSILISSIHQFGEINPSLMYILIISL
jgi:hypothetical protein